MATDAPDSSLDILSVGVLHEAVLTLASQRDVDSLWNSVAQNARWVVPASRVCVLLRTSAQHCRVAARFEKGRLLPPLPTEFELDSDLVDHALSRTKPHWFDGLDAAVTGSDALRDWLRERSNGPLLSVPLADNERRLGAILFDFLAAQTANERIRTGALSALYARHATTTYDLVRSNTELAAKNAALEQTQAQLVSATQEVRNLNQTLEQRIEERTVALESVQQELLQKGRLAVLGQLTGTVAHELRNPLATLGTSFETLKRRTKTTEPSIQRIHQRIERNIRRCERIIADLFDYTRTLPLELERTQMDTWLAATLDEYDLPESVRLDLACGAASATARIDRARFQQVIINLVDNACHALLEHYSDEGGARLDVTTKVAGGDIVLEITDNGPGIEDELKQKVFEPLFSTRAFGVGLGLPLVRQILEQHEGSIELVDGPQGGTRAIVKVQVESEESVSTG